MKSEGTALTLREAAGVLGVSIPGMRCELLGKKSQWFALDESSAFQGQKSKYSLPKIWSRREGDSDLSEAHEPESAG